MRSKSFVWIVAGVLLLCLCVSTVSAVCVHPTICNVDKGVGGTGGYASIQDAIDMAAPGNTITVDSGKYDAFTVDKQLTIHGINRMLGGNPVVRGNASFDRAGHIKIKADGVTVDNFELLQTAADNTYGVRMTSSHNTLNNIVAYNFYYGIYIGDYDDGTNPPEIGDQHNNNINYFSGSGNTIGIYLNGDANTINNVIDHCTLTGGSEGILLRGYSNTVGNCTLSGMTSFGLDVDGQSNIIHGNTFTNILTGTPTAVQLNGPSNNISSNIFTDNYLGIYTYSSSNNNLIYNNKFTNSLVSAYSGTPNTWYVAKNTATNIVGGATIAGNYWDTASGSQDFSTSASCTNGGDGVCTGPFVSATWGINDLYPLTLNAAPPTTSPTVTSITPNTGVNTGSVAISNLVGTLFDTGASVILTPVNPTPVHKGNISIVRPMSVYVSDNYAYVVSSSGYLSDSLEIVDVTDPAIPHSDGGQLVDSGPKSVYVSICPTTNIKYAYVASSSNGLEIIDVSVPTDVRDRGGISTLYSPEEVYVSGNFAYLVSNMGDSLEIVDVTDPLNPVLRGNIINGSGGALLDGAAGVFVSGNNAYVASLYSDALEVIDVTDPDNPVHKGSIINGSGGALLDGAIDVFISGNYAYVSSYNSNALEIIDISDPANPKHKASIVDGSGGAQLLQPVGSYVSGNYAYIVGYSSPALEIVDVSDPANPKHKASIVDGSGSAPYLYESAGIFISGNYAYVADYLQDQLEIVDIGTVTASGVHVNQPTIIDAGTLALNGKAAGPYNVVVTNPDGQFGVFSGGFSVTSGGPTTAQLTLDKTVINDNSGTKTVSDFPLFVDTTQVTSGVPITLTAGSYTASETPIIGYTASVWGGDCAADGSITLAAGAVKTCTITNNDNAAGFKFDASNALTVKFTDTSEGSPTSRLWNFGDGVTSTDQNPTHPYGSANTYTVTLTATYPSHTSVATTSVTVVSKTIVEAKNIVTIAHPPTVEVITPFTQNPLPPETEIKFSGGQRSLTTPPKAGYVAARVPKGRNGDGPTDYYFVDSDGNEQYLETKNAIPSNIILEAEDPYGGGANSITSQDPNPGGPGLGNLGLVQKCSAGDCTHNYAVLIDGGKNATMNHIRYWNDISFMYQTLREYGYPKENIIVLMSDGTNTANADRHHLTQNDVALTDSSPLDLDSDRSNDVTGDALKTTVTTTLTNLGTGKTEADSLFIFTTGHGGPDYNNVATNNSILYLWNEEYISDTEFVNALPTQFGNITMVMEQCYSGGFIDNFATNYAGGSGGSPTQKRIIATAANGSEPSYGNGFSNVWTRGVAMVTDDRKSSTEADSSPNGDGKIAMSEAFAFANKTDPAATESLANHEHPQYATKNVDGATRFMVNGACTPPDSIKLITPNGGETWNVGTKRNITWTSTGAVSGHNVKIELYNSATSSVASSIINPTAASNGLYTWTIPNSAGTSWKVKITDIASDAKATPALSVATFKIVTSSTKGSLNITAVNATNNAKLVGASIYIDGILQANKVTNANGYYLFTASTIDPGSHTVTVKLTGYLDQSNTFVLDPGTQGKVVSFRLEPLGTNSITGLPNSAEDTGTLAITSNFNGAEVWIGGELKGLTPYSEQVIPGTDWQNRNYPLHTTVTVKKYGYAEITQVVSVGRGSTQSDAENGYFLFDTPVPVAPELTEIIVPPNPDFTNDGAAVTVSATVSDPNREDTYDTLSGLWTWTDAETKEFTTTVAVPNSEGLITGDKKFGTPGIYRVSLTVTDKHGTGLSTTKDAVDYIAVVDPNAGYVVGAGSIVSPPGAYTLVSNDVGGTAYFGFTSKYYKGKTVPQGITDFYYASHDMNFYSTSYEWLIIDGAKATYKGTGKICGKPGEYKFVLSAVDGYWKTGTAPKYDKFRIRIIDKTTQVRIYDNMLDLPDETEPTTVLKHGFIIINKNK